MEKKQSKLQSIIAQRLLDFSRERGLSQRHLANLLGVQVGYTNKILQGQANLTISTIEDFGARLNIDLLSESPPTWDILIEELSANKDRSTDRSFSFN